MNLTHLDISTGVHLTRDKGPKVGVLMLVAWPSNTIIPGRERGECEDGGMDTEGRNNSPTEDCSFRMPFLSELTYEEKLMKSFPKGKDSCRQGEGPKAPQEKGLELFP